MRRYMLGLPPALGCITTEQSSQRDLAEFFLQLSCGCAPIELARTEKKAAEHLQVATAPTG